MIIYLLTTLQVLLLASSANAGRVVEGFVKAVYDGDTILLTTRR